MSGNGNGIGIVVADKSPFVREGLAQLLNDDGRFRLVAVVSDGGGFMEAVDTLAFDIAIIGWDMPDLHGREVLEALRGRKEPPKVVVYTGNGAPEIPRLVMQLGGAGFCSKSEPPESLVETVLAISKGRMVFPFMDPDWLLVDTNRLLADPFYSLTAREQELLGCLSHGRTNAQIADDLGISLNTVKYHLKNLYGILGVRNRAQAVASYFRSQRDA